MAEEAFVPSWDRFEAYTKKVIRKHYWRVAAFCEVDDLYQEAYVVFLRCSQKYKGSIKNGSHFFGLYSRALTNRIHTLASRQRFEVNGWVQSRVDGTVEDIHLTELLADYAETVRMEVRLLLEEAPEPVRRLLEVLEESDKRPRMRRARNQRETTNEYLSRLAGLDRTVNMVRMINEWLDPSVKLHREVPNVFSS